MADVSSYFTTPPPKILAEAYTEILSKSEGNIPSKAMLDISLFAPVLPFTAIFAVEGNEKSVYRLVGEAWKQRIGMNPTGMNYFEMVPESNRPTAIAMSRTIIDTPCGLRLLTQQFDENGPNAVTELLCFPLGSDEPEVDGFILVASCPVDDARYDIYKRPDAKSVLEATILELNQIDIGFGLNAELEGVLTNRNNDADIVFKREDQTR